MKTIKARLHKRNPHVNHHQKPRPEKPHREQEISGEDRFLFEPSRITGLTSGREKKHSALISPLD
jgi:hypothetical protein